MNLFSGKKLLVAALFAASTAHAQVTLVSDANKILDSYQEHGTVDFGGEGAGRRMIHAAHNKGEQWHLIVYAQRSPGKWQMTDNKAISEQPPATLSFTGTSDENEMAPEMACTANGKPVTAFGFLQLDKKAGVYRSVAGKALIWSLDKTDKIVPFSVGSIIECKSI